MENTTAMPSPAAMSEQDQKIFRTSLFGFKRDDVLMYVEILNRENGEALYALRQSIEQLETGLKDKTEENAVLSEKTQELEGSITFEKQRADEAHQLVGSLRLEADRANDEAASFKSRLFAKEQEVVVLKADNARLNQSIELMTEQLSQHSAEREEIENAKSNAIAQAEAIKSQAEQDAKTVRTQAEQDAEVLKAQAKLSAEEIAEKARFEAESILEQASAVKASAELQALSAKQKIENEAKLIRNKASNDAVALVSAAEKEKLAAKVLVNNSAQDIASSILVLKAELSDVDNRISAAVNELTRLTSGISGALNETEKNLQTLGVQLEKFPERTAPVAPAAKAVHTAPKRKTTSEFLLEKLTKLLK